MVDPTWAASAPVPDLPTDRPVVLAAFSSTFVTEQVDVLRRVVAALDSLPVTGVVGLGPAVDPADVPGTDRVRVHRAVPHEAVLARASVVVTHGGHGSVLKPLAHGIPVMCIPSFRHQKDNAVRLTERGAGLRLRPSASVPQIAAVERLLVEPTFATAAQDLGRPHPGGDRAVTAGAVAGGGGASTGSRAGRLSRSGVSARVVRRSRPGLGSACETPASHQVT